MTAVPRTRARISGQKPAPGPAQAALAHLDARRYAEAAEVAGRGLKRDRRNADLLYVHGLALCNLGRTSEGLARLRDSLALTPGDGLRWWTYGGFLHFAGDDVAAQRATRRAAVLLPGEVVPLFNICMFGDVGEDDPVVAALHAHLADPALPEEQASFAWYALSRVADRAGRHGEAFDLALKGGAAYGVACGHSEAALAAILRANRPEVLGRSPCGGDPTEAPLFILGMPRSGTTLVESILARHPAVLPCSEMAAGREAELLAMHWAAQNTPIRDAWEAVAWIAPEVEAVAAAHHLGRAHSLAAGRPFARFTDKQPDNSFRLGLLSRMFPNARAIVIRRHPLDTCVSCLMHRFVGISYTYTNTVETLAAEYRAHEAVLAHWRAVRPLRMREIRYEDLVANPEGTTRAMVEFAGLPWDPACLDSRAGSRLVQTASAAQVREGINARSVGRWRRYADRLGPLIEALGGMAQIEAWDRGEG